MPACAGGISTRMILRSMLISDAPLDLRSVSMVGSERPTGLEVSLDVPNARRTAASSTLMEKCDREAALARARDFSPFLREIAATRTDLAEAFLERGAAMAG